RLHALALNSLPSPIAATGFGNSLLVGKTTSEPVLSFVGKEKKLVLNATNWDAIVEITGCEDSRDWPGHKVELFPTTTLMAGRRVDCIRIRFRASGSCTATGTTAACR